MEFDIKKLLHEYMWVRRSIVFFGLGNVGHFAGETCDQP